MQITGEGLESKVVRKVGERSTVCSGVIRRREIQCVKKVEQERRDFSRYFFVTTLIRFFCTEAFRIMFRFYIHVKTFLNVIKR